MPWQVVTYAFLHGSFNHLFFNMLGLWMFGAELEQIWGRNRFIQFYFASVIAAAVTQLIVNYALGTGAPTVGASGGLFGLLLAFAMIFPNRIILLFFVIPMKAKWLVALYGVLELYQGVYVMNSRRRPLRPPRRHARRPADDPLLARPGAVRPALTAGGPEKAPDARTALASAHA